MKRGVKLTNGRMAVAYRVEHLLDRDDLVSLLASTQREMLTGDLLPELSARQVDRLIRETLHTGGAQAAHYWSDHMSERNIGRVQAWAEEHVDRVYGAALTPPQAQP